MMVLISIILFLVISAMSIIKLCGIDDFFNKIITFFYFLSNFIAFMLVYFLYSHKFSFIIEMIFPLIILNMVLILLFVKSKTGGAR